MTPEEIATAAEKRLAELEAESVRLRAVVAAARGVAPAPTITPMPWSKGEVVTALTLRVEPYPVPHVPTVGFPFAPVVTCDNSTSGVMILTGEARRNPSTVHA